MVDAGVSGVWNDNNEYEIEGLEDHTGKPAWLYTRAMCNASFELLRELKPRRRPWVISRAGGYGLQRVARTWTGDNVSSFESMRWGSRIGLGLGLSGLPYYGHDIGGFAGPQPDPELLLRWCQTAVLQPRFAIHSWNDEGEPTELWSFPKWEERLIATVRRHYEFLPTIYDLAIKASLTGVPIQRPLFFEFPEDEGCRAESGNHLVGGALLNLVDFERGREAVSAYLPKGAQWYLPDEGRLLSGGETVEVPYGFDQFRYLQRAGSVVVTAPGLRSGKSGFFPRLRFLVAPYAEGSQFSFTYYEDDGITPSAEPNRYTIEVTEGQIRISSDRLPEEIESRQFWIEVPIGFAVEEGPDRRSGVDPRDVRELAIPAEKLADGLVLSFSGSYAR
jgi:alpha-glucosidase